MSNEQLSENFRRSEFACRCNCGFDDISPVLIKALQELRDTIAQAIHVSSGCRCEAHNRRVGGSRQSQHIRGTAADISCRWLTPQELRRYALQIEAFKGIGLYRGFLHVDVRGGARVRW
jgi:uncharacterized protein YcbK (DUF882 family)